MGKRVVKLGLSGAEVARAIKEVEAYKREVTHKVRRLVETLTDTGVAVARAEVVALGANYTGELANSIVGYFSPSAGVGIIKAGAWYAIYVEYGTGVIGAASPHPEALGWGYDSKGHGEEGWVYYNDRDQKWHTTRGQPSRPFMYNTARAMERQCHRIAREVFAT